jgi:hypothetical protein
MNTNWKFLVAKNNSKIIFGIDSVFARSCFAAVLMATALFADPVAARKTANPSDPKVFFPQRPLPASRDDVYKTMMARIFGRLVLKNGCLRLKSTNSEESFLLIWPGWYGFEVKNRIIIIKDVYARLGPEVRIKLNSEVILGGGGLPDDYVFDAGMLIQPLPKGCKGPYWSVGSIKLAPKGKRR